MERMSAYEFNERFVLWRMKGSHTVKLSHVIAMAGGMKKQSGGKFTERDFDPFAPLPTVESAESIDTKLDSIRKAHNAKSK